MPRKGGPSSAARRTNKALKPGRRKGRKYSKQRLEERTGLRLPRIGKAAPGTKVRARAGEDVKRLLKRLEREGRRQPTDKGVRRRGSRKR